MINFAVGKAFTRNKSSDFKCDTNTGWSSSLPRFMFSIEFISVSATPVMVLSSIWIWPSAMRTVPSHLGPCARRGTAWLPNCWFMRQDATSLRVLMDFPWCLLHFDKGRDHVDFLLGRKRFRPSSRFIWLHGVRNVKCQCSVPHLAARHFMNAKVFVDTNILVYSRDASPLPRILLCPCWAAKQGP